jgi:hypothetical protein
MFFRLQKALRRYNRVVAKAKARAPSTPPLRPFQGCGQMRQRGSEAPWFHVDFLIYYDDHNKIRSFAYVRKTEDGSDLPDGEYEVVDELGERRRVWKKWDGKWQVKWRHRWSRRS